MAGAFSYEVATDMSGHNPPALDLRAPLLRHAKMNVWCHRRPTVEDWTVGDLRPDAVLYVIGERLLYTCEPIGMYMISRNKCDATLTRTDHDTHESLCVWIVQYRGGPCPAVASQAASRTSCSGDRPS